MAGISSKAAGGLENKKKYQQYEFNTDFDLNIYESFYRLHDPQIGRWWQVDPKPESSVGTSPYVAMNNNPISNIDVLGDVVEHEKGDGVSNKEFRKFKREIRQMRRNSSTFNRIYKGFKDDNRTFTYKAVNSDKGGETTKTAKGYEMSISIHGKDPNQGGNEKNSTISLIAHETGHGLLKSNNKEPESPGGRPNSIGMDIFKGTQVMNAYTEKLVAFNQAKELSASHVENVVLGELIQSASSAFSGLKISETYYNGAVLSTIYAAGKPPLRVAIEGDLNKLQGTRTRENYLNSHFNIFTEYGL